jgi:hypothetical protein
MAGKRIYMSKQSEVLRLKALGRSKSEITRLVGIDRATVRRYWDGPVMKGKYHYSTNTGHYPEKKFVDMNYHIGLARREAEMVGHDQLLVLV